MGEKICGWQTMVFATNLEVVISSCSNKECASYLTPVFIDLCKACKQRKPPFDGDDLLRLGDSIKHKERSDTEIDTLLASHCRKCDNFSAPDGACKILQCSKGLPIQSLMKNPTFVCELGEWK